MYTLKKIILCAFMLMPMGAIAQVPFNTMTDLGTLGGSYSNARGVSANGSVIVGDANITGNSGSHAFKYDAGTMLDLGTLGGSHSTASGVSADGNVIVGESYLTGNTAYRAFKYEGGTMLDLGTLGGTSSYARAISADGSVIVGDSTFTSGNAIHAFKHEGGTMLDLGTLGGTSSTARGVSADGSVIVGEANITGDTEAHAFKYEGGTMVDLGTLGGTYSSARGVSADGSVILGESHIAGGGATHAFKYSGGTMLDLGTLGGTSSSAVGISADGSVIVGDSNITGNVDTHAFKYANGTMTDLGTLGGTYSSAVAVSADGSTIVGQSEVSSGQYHAFMYRSAMVDVNNTANAVAKDSGIFYSVFDLNNLMLSNALQYGSPEGCKDNFCLAVGYYNRQDAGDSERTSANVRGSYKLGKYVRAGAFADMAYANNTPSKWDLKKSPLLGGFVEVGNTESNFGLKGKISAAYNESDVTITRSVLANTEAGRGDSAFRSYGVQAEGSYGIGDVYGWKATPTVGVRWSDVKRDAYSETAGADFPITYKAMGQEQLTAIAAIKAEHKLYRKFNISLIGGLEQDLYTSVDNYKGTIDTMGNFELSKPDMTKTRPFGRADIGYEISERQGLGIGFGTVRQTLGSNYNTTIVGQYTISF